MEYKELLKTLDIALKAGQILTDSLEEENKWNTRMILAALEPYGISFPDNWDELSAEEQSKRLKQVIKLMKEQIDA